jgi:hypothetical protein
MPNKDIYTKHLREYARRLEAGWDRRHAWHEFGCGRIYEESGDSYVCDSDDYPGIGTLPPTIKRSMYKTTHITYGGWCPECLEKRVAFGLGIGPWTRRGS